MANLKILGLGQPDHLHRQSPGPLGIQTKAVVLAADAQRAG